MMRRLFLIALAAAFASAAPRAQALGNGLYRVQPGDTLYRIAATNNLTVATLRRFNGITDDVIEVGQTLRVSDRASAPAPGQVVSGTPPVAGQPARPVSGTPPVAGPPVARPPSAPAGAVTHVVEPGDTLFRIAQRYQMEVPELRRLNLLQGDAIQVGQRLTVVPGAGVLPPLAGGVPVNPPAPETAPGVPQAPAGGGRPTGVRSTAPPARPQPVRLVPPRAWSLDDTTVPADLVHFVEPGETLFSIAAAFGFTVDALVAGNALTTAPLEPGQMVYLPAPVDPSYAAARTLPAVSEEGLALVFPDVLTGRPTASGEPYDPLALTASHRDLPLGTVLLVTNPASGRSTFVRVADRGPISRTYLVELSAAAASALELDPNAARRVQLRQLP